MLKVSAKNAIAGYVPCSVCGTPSVVHFPAGGKRKNTPYISCHGCGKTISSAGTKEYVIEHYVPDLPAYAEKYSVDVSAEIEQVAANKWAENPVEYDVKVNGIESDFLCVTDVVTDAVTDVVTDVVTDAVTDAVTVDNDSGDVIADKKGEGEKKGGVMLPVMVGVVLLIVIGGVAYVVARKGRGVAVDGGSDE